MRGLHHWGASAMVAPRRVLHMARTFVFGAYRKPRELNWLVGLALLLLVLGFGFTGYLLPWDQKAYWATVVGTKVPAALPLVGRRGVAPHGGRRRRRRGDADALLRAPRRPAAASRVRASSPSISSFCAGTPRGTDDGARPARAVLPVSGGARRRRDRSRVVLALFWLAARHPAPLERLADPTDTSYVPRPEWYFLPLFQLLKFFKGPLEPIGTAILPGVSRCSSSRSCRGSTAGASRRPRDRRLVLAAGGAGAALLLGLLYFGALDSPKGTVFGSRPRLPAAARRARSSAASRRTKGAAARRATGRTAGPAADARRTRVALAARAHALAGDALVAHVKEKSVKPPAADEDGENPEQGRPVASRIRRGAREGRPRALRAAGADPRRAAPRSTARTAGSAISSTERAAGAGPCSRTSSASATRTGSSRTSRSRRSSSTGSKMPSFKFLPDAELSAMSDYLLALP